MKIKKERKKSVESTKKEKKIGLIFNPAVRLLQGLLVVLLVYTIIIVTALDVIPSIGGILGTAVNIGAMEGWPMLMATWIIPYLFVVAMVFVGEYKLIRFVTKKISLWSDKMIADYRQKQLEIMAKQSGKNDEDKD